MPTFADFRARQPASRGRLGEVDVVEMHAVPPRDFVGGADRRGRCTDVSQTLKQRNEVTERWTARKGLLRELLREWSKLASTQKAQT